MTFLTFIRIFCREFLFRTMETSAKRIPMLIFVQALFCGLRYRMYSSDCNITSNGNRRLYLYEFVIFSTQRKKLIKSTFFFYGISFFIRNSFFVRIPRHSYGESKQIMYIFCNII